MQLDGEKRVEEELVEWGNWSRCTGLSLSLSESGFVHVGITDDRALEIDRVVGILSLRDPLTARVIRAKYIQQLGLRQIAKNMSTNKDKVAALVQLGIGCVAMGLDVRAANDDFF